MFCPAVLKTTLLKLESPKVNSSCDLVQLIKFPLPPAELFIVLLGSCPIPTWNSDRRNYSAISKKIREKSINTGLKTVKINCWHVCSNFTAFWPLKLQKCEELSQITMLYCYAKHDLAYFLCNTLNFYVLSIQGFAENLHRPRKFLKAFDSTCRTKMQIIRGNDRR